jgi:Asp/Glu/hydantoin racemase
MGLEYRLAGEVVTTGAEAVILDCTGMAYRAAALPDAVRCPVIEPVQAAASLALAIVSR